MIENWLRTLLPEELARINDAVEAFRALWSSIGPPWAHEFDGSARDVQAIDYLHYEQINFPTCGIDGAALICGEVLRRAAKLEWMSSADGNWFVADSVVAICPIVRVQEIYFTGVPQFGRFSWFLSRAAMDCLPFADGESQIALCKMVTENEEFVHDLTLAIAKILPDRR